MNINANIQVYPGEASPGTPDECAANILTALGGDPAKDTCYVTMTGSGQAGEPAGAPMMGPMTMPPGA